MCKIQRGAACQAVICMLAFVVVSARDFDYGPRNGPEHWAENDKRCSGKHQSPININKLSVSMMQFPDMGYKNFDATPKTVTLSNNGHTVQVTMDFAKGKEPRITGGPLDSSTDVFQFEQFHFHWGENNTVGSEDMINNVQFSAELHVVMRNLIFANLSSAMGQERGLVVMAFFIWVDRKADNYYGEFAETLPFIREKGSSRKLATPLPLMKFLAKYSTSYYSYMGSLTTPPCTEKVLWIDYQQPILISEHQMNLFRNLTVNNEHLKNNFRPIQPLNDRLIYENIPRYPPHRGWTSTSTSAGFTACKNVVMLLGLSMSCMLLKGSIFTAFN